MTSMLIRLCPGICLLGSVSSGEQEESYILTETLGLLFYKGKKKSKTRRLMLLNYLVNDVNHKEV